MYTLRLAAASRRLRTGKRGGLQPPGRLLGGETCSITTAQTFCFESRALSNTSLWNERVQNDSTGGSPLQTG
jgi:hypothetical protein